jgi:uncharacterized membrane protein
MLFFHEKWYVHMILRFVLVDCPAEEVFFMYYTELIGLQRNMKAMISVPVTVHVKTKTKLNSVA